ncbi:MAG: ribosome silencing factor [Rhodocyclaceae bacterium]|nr:ribosome silencing factor [Rhodocyclaceae bacterium]
MEVKQLLDMVVDALDDIKAHDVEVIDTRQLSTLFEWVVVASGDSNRQTKALVRHVFNKVRDAGVEVIGMEGEHVGEWVLLDLGPIVVHVMQPAIRSYYNLEELWHGRPYRPKSAGIGPGGLPAASFASEPM